MTNQQSTISVGTGLLGRVLNSNGEPLDHRGPLDNVQRAPLSTPAGLAARPQQLFETGIKPIDLLGPLPYGGVMGLFANAGVGKFVVTEELLYNTFNHKHGYAVCLSIGESSYEASEIMTLLREGELEDNAIMLFEPATAAPTIRHNMLLAGVTIAEHFQNAGREVLLLIDKHITTTGGQDNFNALLRTLKDHAVTTILLGAEDDFSLPGELDSRVVLSRAIFERKIYPAVDPQFTTSRLLQGEIISPTHSQVAAAVKQILQREQELQSTPVEQLSAAEQHLVRRARRIQFFLAQPFHVAEAYTEVPGEYVPADDTVKSFQALLEGRYDDVPEQAFYFVGSIEQAQAKAGRR